MELVSHPSDGEWQREDWSIYLNTYLLELLQIIREAVGSGEQFCRLYPSVPDTARQDIMLP